MIHIRLDIRAASGGFLGGLALGMLLLLSSQPGFAERPTSLSGQVMYERGARSLRAGDTEAALEFLDRASDLDPRNVDILSLYGRALLIAGKPDKAMAVFDRFAASNPGSTKLNYYQGIASYQLGRWAKTIEYLGPEVEKRPGEGLIRLYLGVAYQETGQPEKAREMLEEAAQVDPTLRAAALYRIGVMALEQKNAEEATKYLTEVEQIAAGSALARSARNYLDQIDSGLYRPVAAFATLLGGYDSNVTLQTGEELTFQPDLKSGVGSGNFGLSTLLVDTERFDLRVGANAFVNVHGSNPANNYDQALVRGFAIGSLEITDWMRFNLGYSFEYVWLNYSKFRATNDVDVSLRFIPFGDFVTSVFYEIREQEYLLNIPPSLKDLNADGAVQRAGIQQIWYTPDWFGWGKGFIGATFEFRHESSEGTEYDSNGYQPIAQIGVPLPFRMFWTASAGYEWRLFRNASCFYDGSNNQAGLCGSPVASTFPKRRDKIVRVFSNLRISVTEAFYLDLSYQYSNRFSNTHFYRYDRNVIEFGGTYRY